MDSKKNKKSTSSSLKKKITSVLKVIPSKKNGSPKQKSNQEEFLPKVQEKAFEIFVRRGGFPGLEQFDWFVAESIVKLEQEAQKSPRKSRIKSDSEDYQKAIQEKAYEIYKMRGGQGALDQFDWFLAQDLFQLENN